MTISEAPSETIVGKVVEIYRECEVCEAWKPLSHFLLHYANMHVRASVHVCAGCRARKFGQNKE